MDPKRPTRERGIALLMTLAFITLAISLAVETNRHSRRGVESTAAFRSRLVAGQMAMAGVHGAMAVLIQDRYASETDHLLETWASPEKLGEALRNIVFDDGRLEVRISDENARIQINALVDFPQSRQFIPEQQQIVERVIDLARRDLELQSDVTPADMVNAIKDWLDRGDDEAITGLNGAESDYYQGLDPPYRARNGAMLHIGELARVKGISPALFDGRDDRKGLRDLITVHGAEKGTDGQIAFAGKVNLNTAPRLVVAALMPPEYSDLAEAVVQYRQEADEAVLEGQAWHRDAPGIAGLELNPNRFAFASNIFRIQATAEHTGSQRTLTAVVAREMARDGKGWTCRILAWELP